MGTGAIIFLQYVFKAVDVKVVCIAIRPVFKLLNVSIGNALNLNMKWIESTMSRDGVHLRRCPKQFTMLVTSKRTVVGGRMVKMP